MYYFERSAHDTLIKRKENKLHYDVTYLQIALSSFEEYEKKTGVAFELFLNIVTYNINMSIVMFSNCSFNAAKYLFKILIHEKVCLQK